MSSSIRTTKSIQVLKTAFDAALLDAVYETILPGVQVLEPVIKDGKLTDFRYVFVSPNDHDPLAGKWEGLLFLEQFSIAKSAGLDQLFMRVLESGHQLDEILRYKVSNSEHWLHLKIQKFQNGLLISREDITEIKVAEDRIKELNQSLINKNRELSLLNSELKTFNSIAAQDYRETLKNLYTSLEYIIVNEATEFSPSGKANLRRAQSAVQKMKLLTEDIISYSEINLQLGNKTKVDLNDVLASVKRALNNKISDTTADIQANALPEISGYTELITVLFTNLLDNGLKFRKPRVNPVITVNAEVLMGNRIAVDELDPDQYYDVITFSDNGIGFSVEHATRIFEMFYRTQERAKDRGSGIGLAICKKIMAIHKGSIRAECNPECTTFHCYFPKESW